MLRRLRQALTSARQGMLYVATLHPIHHTHTNARTNKGQDRGNGPTQGVKPSPENASCVRFRFEQDVVLGALAAASSRKLTRVHWRNRDRDGRHCADKLTAQVLPTRTCTG